MKTTLTALALSVTLLTTAQAQTLPMPLIHSPYAQGATAPVTAYDKEQHHACMDYFSMYTNMVQSALEDKQARRSTEFRLCVAESKLDKYANSCFDHYSEYEGSALAKALGYPLK